MENNLKYLQEWNENAGLQLSKEEAKEALLQFLPTLKRWREAAN